VELVGVPFAGRYLHLDMIFNQVAERLALACPAALPPAFLARLEQERVGLIEVDEQEVFEHACNVLPLGPASVLSHTANRRVNRLLRAEGFQVIALDLTELRRGGGGPRCLTLPLERQ
jgi:N-dimethylarginine dimethylaminohydrolase